MSPGPSTSYNVRVRLTLLVRTLHFVDPVDQRIASAVHTAGWLVFALAASGCLVAWAWGAPTAHAALGAAVALSGLASQWLVWRGRLRSAGWMLMTATVLGLAAIFPP